MNQTLFDHMANEHGLTLLESEMHEIECIVLANHDATRASYECGLKTGERKGLLRAAEICRKPILPWNDPLTKTWRMASIAFAQAIEAEIKKLETK